MWTCEAWQINHTWNNVSTLRTKIMKMCCPQHNMYRWSSKMYNIYIHTHIYIYIHIYIYMNISLKASPLDADPWTYWITNLILWPNVGGFFGGTRGIVAVLWTCTSFTQRAKCSSVSNYVCICSSSIIDSLIHWCIDSLICSLTNLCVHLFILSACGKFYTVPGEKDTARYECFPHWSYLLIKARAARVPHGARWEGGKF